MTCGLYIHVPFCVSRCDYCAFATWSDRFDFTEKFVELVIREIRERSLGRAFTSVFFGGGTPSLLSLQDLERIMSVIDLADNAEVTLEANPDSLYEDPNAYGELGITRVSLGIQSLQDQELLLLGRHHSAKDSLHGILRLMHSKLEYSCDFIFGVRGGNPDLLVEDLLRVISLERPPTHLSVYALSIEPGTPIASKSWLHPREDDDAATYLKIDDSLAQNGFRSYEISNYCKPGHASMHNWNYWMQGEYLGVGPSAHSYLDGVRLWNIRDSYRWGNAVETGASPTAGYEKLYGEAFIFEGLGLLLRTALGVPSSALALDDLPDDLYTVTSDNRIVLTAKGRLLENQLARRLLPENVTMDVLMEHQALSLAKLLEDKSYR